MRVRLVIWRSRVRSPLSLATSFVETDHGILSTVIISLPLILKGQMPVSGKICAQVLLNSLED